MTTRKNWLINNININDFLSPYLQSIGIANENIKGFLNPDFYSPVFDFNGVRLASVLINDAIRSGRKILLHGDFDLDGVSATALLYSLLVSQNVDVNYLIPNHHGVYEKFFDADVLVFIDAGYGWLSNDYAKSIISIDHHYINDVIPDGVIVVNPHTLIESHSARHLSSVGVAYLVAKATFPQLELAPYLDYVALGLLADRVLLVQDTRYWVQLGLKQLNNTRHIGLQKLLAILELEQGQITADDVAFKIAPALNSFGRFGSPQKAFDLLTTRDTTQATILATEANSLNQQRKLITQQILKAARDTLIESTTLLDWAAIVLENPHWDTAMLGSVASQLAQEYQKPVALMASQNTGFTRGSVRGVGLYNVTSALDDISDILHTAGGHYSAAGFSLHNDNLPLFRRRFSNALLEQSQNTTQDTLVIASEVNLDAITSDLTNNIEKLAPFGNGNRRPVFVSRNLTRRSTKHLGAESQHRRLNLYDEQGSQYDVFWWNSSHRPQPEGTFDLAYTITPPKDDSEKALLTLVDWQQVKAPENIPIDDIKLVDCRKSITTIQESDLMIWAEGLSTAESNGVPYSQLEQSDALLVFTAPPNAKAIAKLINRVQPKRIYIHAALPRFDQPQRLLEALTALLRTVKNKLGGKVTVTKLAERTAHTNETITLALNILNKVGIIEITWLTSQTIEVHHADKEPPHAINYSELNKALDETAAYRRYVRTIHNLENLL